MRVVSVGRVENPVAVLAAVGHRVPQMLGLNVILQGGQACVVARVAALGPGQASQFSPRSVLGHTL